MIFFLTYFSFSCLKVKWQVNRLIKLFDFDQHLKEEFKNFGVSQKITFFFFLKKIQFPDLLQKERENTEPIFY